MYLMYVDESGDKGLVNSPTRYFILTGIVLHELRWREALERFIAFRQRMKAAFGLKLREEIHAAHMISRPGELVRIKRNDRLAIIRHFVDELAAMDFVSVINVRVDKQGKGADYNAFERAWQALIQRFENTLNARNFRGPANADDKGIIFCDETDDAVVRALYRKMRAFNPIPNMAQFGVGHRQMPILKIIEDPNVRKSHHSYFIQAADVAAFAAYQWYAPSAYMREKGARNYFERLGPALCRVASPKHPFGIVEL